MRHSQLVAFLTVVETRHFTRAAMQLGISQPSLSKQIQSLEHTLGATLFTRQSGHIHLTDIGETLKPHAMRLTSAHDDALADINNHLALNTGRLRIGATPTICSWLIPPLIASYHEEFPGIAITITEAGSATLTTDLENGILDLALIATPTSGYENAQVTITALLHETLVVASSATHPPLTTQACIGLTQLSDQPFILPANGYDLRTLTIDTCNKAGFHPNTIVDGGNTDTIVDLVATGIGITLLPAMTATANTHIRTTPLAPPGAGRTIALARSLEAPTTKASAAFEKHLEQFLTAQHAWGKIPEGLHVILFAPILMCKNRIMNENSDADLQHITDAAFNLARTGETERLIAFIDGGLPVNIAGTTGDTLLMLAAYHGHAETVKALVNVGADIEKLNDRGQSPLAGAVFKNFPDVIQVLLEHGADSTAGTPSAKDIAAMFNRDIKFLTKPV